MSESFQRRRFPTPVGNGRRSLMTRRTVSRCVSGNKNRSKSTNRVFERSFSEPSLNRRRDSNYLRRPSPMRGLPREEPDSIVYLPRIGSEVFASSSSLSSFSSPSSSSPIKQEREAAKVVISVAVEGSPGPVRTMVKLSCNVEEMIKIIMDKYREEGRTPKLDQRHDAFELHQSHFSIQCLEKREIIGEIGSRSFYLRKRVHDTGVSFPGIAPVRTILIPSSNVIESWIAQIIGKFMRRTKKVWNILVCTQ